MVLIITKILIDNCLDSEHIFTKKYVFNMQSNQRRLSVFVKLTKSLIS